MNPMSLFTSQHQSTMQRTLLARLHIDAMLLLGVTLLSLLGLFVLYSASNQSIWLVKRQVFHLIAGFVALFIAAQIPPRFYFRWTPVIYVIGLILLVLVLVIGDVSKGAQRWLAIGGFRFQPSEVMKLSLPMMVAWYLSQKPLPPNFKHTVIAALFVISPIVLIAKQPDLGTSILIGSSGFFVIFLAGISWKWLFSLGGLGLASLPLLWLIMHDYQRQRVLTFLNPESDPLGSGWNIIQSKIAIGSGGLFGKGWLSGSQAHLDFLPEQSTDFIFAVWSEEFGLVGVLMLLLLYLFIIIQGFRIGVQGQNSYARLLAGSITLTFFIYVAINIGMVSGLLPVVGLPLPLVSFGGTSIVTLMTGFGILMSIHTHRRLVRE